MLDSCGPICNPYFLRKHLPQDLRRREITVVTSNDSKPFLQQAPNGLPYGFDVDLMNHISYVYGFNFVYQYKPFEELLPTVQNNRYTISISMQTVTEERIEFVDFAQFFRSGSGFLVRSSYTEQIDGLAEVCGKKVGVITGSIQEIDAQNQIGECTPELVTISSLGTVSELVDALLNEDIDVVLLDEPVVVNLALESKGVLKAVGEPYNVQPFGILCNKEDSTLCCRMVNAINHLIREGTYKKLLERYSFNMEDNGVCPSQINLFGDTCSSRCTLDLQQCRNALN